MDKFDIPYSSFKGGNFKNGVAYSASKDEWTVTSDLFENISPEFLGEPKAGFEKVFDEISLRSEDELSF